ncbi:ABC transporter permease [Leptolyngbya sp. AN02str]|uniref:ABC transporter permease n=1 Tax=Leptolyngbya sp. AN02str TaxID=3423363 RepID=UPI003D31BDC3
MSVVHDRSNPPSIPTKQFLQPSVFWSIRQGFPVGLSVVLMVGAIALPILLWALISYGGWVRPIFLPTPTAVVQAGSALLQEGLVTDVMASCSRVAGGFLLAAIVGVPIGLLMGTFHSMDRMFAPLVGTVRYMPVVAFVPLLVIWVGLGETSKILIIFLGVVLYNAIMVADAVKFIPNDLINVAYTLGATRRDVLLQVIMPATFPSVLDTLRVNISGAWNYLVIAELVAAQNGLGFRIVQSQRFLQTDKVLFCIALIGVIGLLLDYLLKWISRQLTPWADQTRH